MTSTTVQLMINLNERLLIEQIETDRERERERTANTDNPLKKDKRVWVC